MPWFELTNNLSLATHVDVDGLLETISCKHTAGFVTVDNRNWLSVDDAQLYVQLVACQEITGVGKSLYRRGFDCSPAPVQFLVTVPAGTSVKITGGDCPLFELTSDSGEATPSVRKVIP